MQVVNSELTKSALRREIESLGAALLFLGELALRMKFSLFQIRETLRQIYYIGVRSLVIIMTGGLFVGLVLTLQTYDTLNRFGAGDAVSTVLSLSLFKELGPVLTAILFAGRAGTAVTAEIGLMKTTEQLDALDLMGIDPMERIVQPRLIAGVIAVPVLTLIFNMLALLGGVIFGIVLMGIDTNVFWGNMQNSVDLWQDFASGMFKSIGFGLI